MIETSSSTANKKFDFVWLSYRLAGLVPIPFWILIYVLNLLPVLFPSYRGKDMVNPLFFMPILIVIVAGSIGGACLLVFFKIEKELYPNPDKNLFIEIPSNDLLFNEYIIQKSYGKLFMLLICWICRFITIAATATMIFGFFIFLKYIRS